MNDLDFSRSSKVKSDSTIWTSLYMLYDFLYMSNSNCKPSLDHFQHMSNQNFNDLHLTFQGQKRLNLIPPFDPPYLTSYTWLIVTICLTCTISKIWATKNNPVKNLKRNSLKWPAYRLVWNFFTKTTTKSREQCLDIWNKTIRTEIHWKLMEE